MGYTEYYLSSKVAEHAAFGRKMWFLRAPRSADHPSGDTLLGSLVEEKTEFWSWSNYPVPYHLTTPQLFLTALEGHRKDLGIPDGADIIITEDLVEVSFTLNRSTGLDLAASASVPAVPAKLSLGVDFSKTHSIKFSLSDEGSRIRYIPTDYLARIARHLDGDAQKIDPHIAVEIDDNLIVDMILLAKSYRVTFNMERELSPFFEGEAEAANSKFKGKIKAEKENEHSFIIEVKSDSDHLIGFKTIDWDDIWDEPSIFDWNEEANH